MENVEFEGMEEGIRQTKERMIAFRVDEKTYLSIEGVAEEKGKKPNEWARELVVNEVGKEGPMTPGERLLFEVLFEELARARFIMGNGLMLMARGELNVDGMRYVLAEADEKSDQIAHQLLEKRKALKARSVEKGENGAGE